MNTRTRLFALLLTALGLATINPVSAAPDRNQAYSHSVKFVERFGNTVVARESTTAEVLQTLGKPSHKLSDNVWAYYNYHAGADQPAWDDCSTLLVTLTDGRVSDLKLINDRAFIVYATKLRAKADDKAQVAAK